VVAASASAVDLATIDQELDQGVQSALQEAKVSAAKKGKAAAATKAKPNGKAPKADKGGTVTSLASRRPAAAAPTADAAEPTSLVTTADLDRQVQVIEQSKTDGAMALHRLGVAANEIAQNGLWKLRTNGKGVPTFRTFKQFCVEELKMTAVHVYRAIKVAEQFDEDDVKGLSGNQVRLMLQVPAESRSEVMEAAKNALRGKQKELPAPKAAVTVALAMKHSKLKMYKRATTGSAKVGDTEDAVRAKSIKESPWAVLDLSNKVRMIARLVVDLNGELVLDVEFRRGTPVL
jgi:hypothetical protein